MGVSSSAVEIRINVVDGNTQQTVAQFKENMDQLGAAGAGSGKKIKQGMDEAGAGVLTTREKTRLLTEEIGVHIPRAMQKLIGQSKLASAALNAVGTVMIGLGAIQIGWMFLEAGINAAKKFYENFLDVNGALEKYQEEARKTAQTKLFDESGLQTQIAMLGDVNRQIDQLNQKKKGSNGFLTSFLMGDNFEYFSPKDQKRLNDLTTQADAGKLKGIEEQHKQNLQRIENERTVAEAKVPEYARSRVGRQFDDRRANEEQMYIERRDRYTAHIYNRGLAPKDQVTIPDDDGWREAQAIREQTKSKDDAADLERGRANSIELRHLQDAAVQSGLHGSELMHAQEAAAIADLREKGMASPAAVNAVRLKFHNEEMKRLEDEQRQTLELQHQVQLVGMTGIGRTQIEGANKIDMLNADKNIDPAERDKRIALVRMQTQEEIEEQQRSFAEEADRIADQSVAHQISGYARIRAQANQEIDAIERKFDEAHNKMDLTAPGAQNVLDADTAKLGHAVDAINGGADRQEAELRRKNTQETEQIEAQARIKSLSDEKQKSAAIYAEYDERVRKWREALGLQEIDESDFNRRTVAAAEERDAKLVQLSRETHEKMAREFTGFFKSLDHPLEALKQMGDKVAGNMAATLVQRMQERSQSGHGHGSVLDTIFGGGKHKDGSHATAAHPGAANAGKVFALQNAVIQVQSGTIQFGATAMGSSAVPGAAGGSTTLMGGGADMGYGISSGSTATSGGSADAGAGSFTTGSGSAPIDGGSTVGNVIGNAQQGMSAFKQAKGIFGKSGSGESSSTAGPQYDQDGNYIGNSGGAPSSNGGMLGGGGVGANAMGAASGALGLFSAYEGNGGLGGALSGAMSGMQLGMAVGGPIGAAIGAAAGAIVGGIGFGGREKARVYDLKQLRPRLKNDMDSFQQGSMDYTGAYSDMQGAQTDAKKSVSQWGPGANSYYQDTMKPEVSTYLQKLTREAKAGRGASTVSAGQFDVGGPIGDFGSLTTTPDHGWIHAQRGEFMVQQKAAIPHYQALQAINGGASHTDMARYYGGGREGTVMPAQSGDVTHQWTVHAVDAKSFGDLLMRNPVALQQALNLSKEQYAGEADA